jgi:SAM-dependent methyltransferase
VNRKTHWNQVYQTNAPDDVSWYQRLPDVSRRLIDASGVGKNEGVPDVDAGASVLVDCLLDAGFRRLAVLDISAAALAQARQRLGGRAGEVEWFEADVTGFQPARRHGLWHDRAVFHFLTDPADRSKYVQTLIRTLVPGGHVLIATFAIDGPHKCSGLDVIRYDAGSISSELGAASQLLGQAEETHVTPWHTQQKFSYFHFVRQPALPP